MIELTDLDNMSYLLFMSSLDSIAYNITMSESLVNYANINNLIYMKNFYYRIYKQVISKPSLSDIAYSILSDRHKAIMNFFNEVIGSDKIIPINNAQLTVKEYSDRRVVTFKDIDTVHERPSGTARRNFNKNKKHFIEGMDYFKIQPNEIRTVGIESPNGGTVVTETGYLMLVKSFKDDLAWKVQRELVNNYFKRPEPPAPCEPKKRRSERRRNH